MLAVKALVSPYTPPTAYIAVAFQGLMAAALFPVLKINYLSVLLLGIVTMIESAVQKLFVVTLFFGQSFWNAVNELSNYAAGFFGLTVTNSSYWLIGFYLLLFMLTGILVGLFTLHIIKQFSNTLAQPSFVINDNSAISIAQSIKPKKKFYTLLLVMLFMIAAIVLLSSSEKPAWVQVVLLICRTSVILLAWYLLLMPLLSGLIKKWLKKTQSKYAAEINRAIELFPSYKIISQNSWQQSKQHKGIGKLFSFVSKTIAGIIAFEPAPLKENN